MLCTVVEPTQRNCTIVVKETSKSGTWTLPAYTPMSTDPKPYLQSPRNYREFSRGRFQLFRVDKMHSITTSRFILSRSSISCSRQVDVRLVQNVCRYRQSDPVHTFRCRKGYSRNVVQCQSDESFGERLSHCSGARSVAFPAKKPIPYSKNILTPLKAMIFWKIKAFNWIQPKLFTTRDYVHWLNSC